MSEPSALRDTLISVWVVASGIIGYGCLAYAVAREHGGAMTDLVNRFLPGSV